MKYIRKYLFLLLVIIAVLPLWSMIFNQGMPLVHDGQDHVARIANFYQSLSYGIWVPRWAMNLNWGYGHPILMFLYPLPSYIASLFHFFGFSLVDSTKLVFGVSYILSIFTMYLFMGTMFGKRAGVIGALLYGFAPYRFVDMYIRGALGEHIAFLFPPLICYFLFKLAEEHKSRLTIRYVIYASLSLAGLILSHNAVALMFVPVILLFGLYLLFFVTRKRKHFLLHFIVTMFGGFALSAFFWVPALIEGKFTLRDIVTKNEALKRFVPWTWFFYSPWNYISGDQITKSLGLFQWVGVLSGLMALMKLHDKKIKIIITVTVILLLVSLFIMTSYSTFIWRYITLLQKFQFPWRFLSLSAFLTAVLGGIGMSNFYNYLSKKVSNYVFIFFCILIVFSTIHMWHPKAYQVKHESFYSGIYPGTTDTGESSPIWSVRFMEHAPARPMEVISGEAEITEVSRKPTEHVYRITARTPSRILENTLFFPGWKVYTDGIQAGLQWQDPAYRGLMTFRVDEGEHTVRVVFGNTKIRLLSEIVSIATAVVTISLLTGTFIWKRNS